MDRNRELVPDNWSLERDPDNWSLLRERMLTTGLCSDIHSHLLAQPQSLNRLCFTGIRCGTKTGAPCFFGTPNFFSLQTIFYPHKKSVSLYLTFPEPPPDQHEPVFTGKQFPSTGKKINSPVPCTWLR